MIIGIDFDGTVVEHEFPIIGRPVPLAQTVLNRLCHRGDKLILWSVRSGPYLREAASYLEERGVKLWGINKNPNQHIFSDSVKAHCDVYIDDKALGCPLIYPTGGKKPYVDWNEVGRILGVL